MQRDEQDARIENIVCGDDESTFQDCVGKFFEYLKSRLQLPCVVTGIEDFDWEEFYVIGPGDPEEYKRLCKNQPSYSDTYELLAIESDVSSEWMMCSDDDIAGHVRRTTDGKKFALGLTEIEPVDKASMNYRLLNDYAVWFVNNQ